MKGIGSSWQCLQCNIVELLFSSFDIPESKDFVIGKISIQIHEHVREKERERARERIIIKVDLEFSKTEFIKTVHGQKALWASVVFL